MCQINPLLGGGFTKFQIKITLISRFREIGFKIPLFSWNLEHTLDHKCLWRVATGTWIFHIYMRYEAVWRPHAHTAGDWCNLAIDRGRICLTRRSLGTSDVQAAASVTSVMKVKQVFRSIGDNSETSNTSGSTPKLLCRSIIIWEIILFTNTKHCGIIFLNEVCGL